MGPVEVTAGRRGKGPADREENRLWLVKQFLVNAKAHAFMSGARNGETGSLFEAVLRQLNEVWKSFYPGRDQSFSVEPVAEDPDAGFDVFLVERNGTRIPLDSLGSGQLEIFAFFGALLRTRFQEGVVIIDEPELHLDPPWQEFMLDAIRSFLPRVQIIVATHSPAVYDSVYFFQRHLLLPAGDPRIHGVEDQTQRGSRMSPSSHMAALYNRPIILWVEDLTTRWYLGSCWKDRDLRSTLRTRVGI